MLLCLYMPCGILRLGLKGISEDKKHLSKGILKSRTSSQPRSRSHTPHTTRDITSQSIISSGLPLAQGEVKQQPTQTSQLPKSLPATQHDAGRHFCSLCNVCIIPNVCTFLPPRPQNELTPRASCHRPIARSRPRSSQSQPSRNHSADVVANFPDREMGEKAS